MLKKADSNCHLLVQGQESLPLDYSSIFVVRVGFEPTSGLLHAFKERSLRQFAYLTVCCPSRVRTWTLLSQIQTCCQLHQRTICCAPRIRTWIRWAKIICHAFRPEHNIFCCPDRLRTCKFPLQRRTTLPVCLQDSINEKTLTTSSSQGFKFLID